MSRYSSFSKLILHKKYKKNVPIFLWTQNCFTGHQLATATFHGFKWDRPRLDGLYSVGHLELRWSMLTTLKRKGEGRGHRVAKVTESGYKFEPSTIEDPLCRRC
ncbi:hypothetical protein TNCV_848311 [Trichonephila clavipes]|uniref:Uncharacterized protein n=1 Tax=Trichonephila clavipes TaxID=2585209 RepID=A0A8X6RII8_TRICX|nr:hypothetical protein TNCV_848311 [Trichonephila clavipes]